MSTIGIVTSGAMGIDEVVSQMRKNIIGGKTKPDIRKMAGLITSKIDAKNADQSAQAVYKFLRDNITYTYDPKGIEYLQDPIAVLQTKTGDCDDFTTLGSALLESIGHQTRIVLAKQNGSKHFTHVYFEYFSPEKKQWVAMDAIIPFYPGYVHPAITSKKIYDLRTGKSVSVNIGAGEASAAVLAANAALSATGVGLPAAVALQAAAAVVDVVTAIIPKKYLTANWWGGKNSIWGKAFGKGYSISAQRANEALYNAFHDALGYELTDFDGFEKRHKGAFTVWVKWWNGKEWIRPRSRFGDGGTAEMIREIGDQIKNFPKPGFPKEAWAEAAKIVSARYQTAQASPTGTPAATTAQGTPQQWPVMPESPENINSLDLQKLGVAKAQTAAAAGQIYLKAKSLGINEAAPTPGLSIMYADVLKYWNQVNDYRNRVISKAQGGSGTGTGTEEAGMGTGTKIVLGLTGAAVLYGIAQSGSSKN